MDRATCPLISQLFLLLWPPPRSQRRLTIIRMV
eukprot:SAG25_NODE_7383_length_484_cov_0.794805_1_plen_32_part_10